MNVFPRIIIDLSKIRANTQRIVDIAKQSHIEIIGVTKATCGDPKVGRAMMEGGAIGLADSRIDNIKRLKTHLPTIPFMLLRSPQLSEITDVIRYADSSINTEITVIKALNFEAEKQGVIHKVLLMAELGELREGILNEEFKEIISYVKSSTSLKIMGLGMNLTCFSGVIPSKKKIDEFLDLVKSLETKNDIHFEKVSGGNTANIPCLEKEPSHNRIDQLRVGEGILLGRETIHRTPIPGTYQDAFVLEVELIEVKKKSSVPDGDLTENAFGEKPVFEDQGMIIRGIAAIGLQDVIIDDLVPCDESVHILGGSSDHLVLQLPKNKYKVGDNIRFIPKYGALVHLFTSSYVHKTYQ